MAQQPSLTGVRSPTTTTSRRRRRVRMRARWLPTFMPSATTCAPLCRNMAEPNRLRPSGGRANNHVIHQTEFHQGPLPTPKAFEKYNRMLAGAADGISKSPVARPRTFSLSSFPLRSRRPTTKLSTICVRSAQTFPCPQLHSPSAHVANCSPPSVPIGASISKRR